MAMVPSFLLESRCPLFKRLSIDADTIDMSNPLEPMPYIPVTQFHVSPSVEGMTDGAIGVRFQCPPIPPELGFRQTEATHAQWVLTHKIARDLAAALLRIVGPYQANFTE